MLKNILYHGTSKDILSTRLSSIELQPKKVVVVVVVVVVFFLWLMLLLLVKKPYFKLWSTLGCFHYLSFVVLVNPET